MALPWWATGLAIALMVVGLLGVFLPAIPGVAFMWVVVLVYTLAEKFTTIDPLSFAVLTILGVAGATSDFWMSQLGARVSGASLSTTLFSLLGGTVGGLIGFFVGGIGAVPGMLAGSILGSFLNEYRVRKDWKAALKATLGMLVGFTLSTLVKLVLGGAMLGIFIWQVVRG
jgi:uncharacterized protein YqgC (DUF456 family)